MAKRTTLTLRLSDDGLYWKLDRLARYLNRSMNGAAQECLRVGIAELNPRQERVKPLGQLAQREFIRRFAEHVSPAGVCNCAAGASTGSNFQKTEPKEKL